VVLPTHMAEEIADEAVEMTAFQDFATERVLVEERYSDPTLSALFSVG
jgi:regulator of RNase E activity RraA